MRGELISLIFIPSQLRFGHLRASGDPCGSVRRAPTHPPNSPDMDLDFCYPEISSPPSQGDRGEVGMEQRQTISRLHEARPREGGVDNQAEADESTQHKDSPRHERLREEG